MDNFHLTSPKVSLSEELTPVIAAFQEQTAALQEMSVAVTHVYRLMDRLNERVKSM